MTKMNPTNNVTLLSEEFDKLESRYTDLLQKTDIPDIVLRAMRDELRLIAKSYTDRGLLEFNPTLYTITLDKSLIGDIEFIATILPILYDEVILKPLSDFDITYTFKCDDRKAFASYVLNEYTVVDDAHSLKYTENVGIGRNYYVVYYPQTMN